METLLILVPSIILALIIHKTIKRNNKEFQKDIDSMQDKQNILDEVNRQIYEIAVDTSIMTKAELVATLKWMLQLNIIDHNMYNLLYLKSLPYTKG